MKAKMIDDLSNKFELIQQFRDSNQDTNIELADLLKEFKIHLGFVSDLLIKSQKIENWKCCNIKNKKYIEGAISPIGSAHPKLIMDQVIYFKNGRVRTKENFFILGKEICNEDN